jgi:hypothetical protein
MRISKVGHDFGTSLRRYTQPSTSPNIQSLPTRTRVLYWQWKKLSLWREGSFVASIADRNYEEMWWWKWSETAVCSVDVQSPHWLQVSCITFSHTQKCKDKMYPTDRHYLFNIAEEMRFPAARCAQGNSVCMYGKSASSSVEAMSRANKDIVRKQLWTILNATLILLKKESTRYNKQQDLVWNHAHVLTPKGLELMEEAFNNVNVQDFKVLLTENENEHSAIVSKKSTSHREYSVNLPKSATLGSRFGKCTCGFPNTEGIPCQHMVAVSNWGELMD